MSQEPDRVGANSAVAYFENHAEHYEKSQYGTTRRTFVNARHERLVALLSSIRLDRNAVALDAGCGPGNLLPVLAGRCRRLYEMDMSSRMIELARAKSAGAANVKFQLGSIVALPFADSAFDVVCSAGVIEYLPDYRDAIREMHRVLRPGGLLVLSTTNLLAPSHWLRPVSQPVARIPAVARLFGIQPATFRLRYAAIPTFKKRLERAGFVLEQERYFYLTLPRPLDRLFPNVARRLEEMFDRHMENSVKHMAEGYIAVARKRG